MGDCDVDLSRKDSRSATRTLGPSVGQWVGIAANAGSGRGVGRLAVEELTARLSESGIPCRVGWTPDQRAAIVAEAKEDEGCRCLVAAGGDGTVAALINDRPSVPIAVLPAGTENLFARHFQVGRRPERVARSIIGGRVAALDLGLAGDRRFSLMAGIGFDADVVTRHHRSRVALTGLVRPTNRVAYVEPVLRSSFTYRFPLLSIRVEDEGQEETLVGTTAFLFNLPRYALGLPFAPEARGDDGLLDLVLFREAGPFRALHYLWLVLRGLHLRRDDVYHRRIRKVTVNTPIPVPFQLDGDPGGEIAVTHLSGLSIEVLPRRIEVILP